MADLFDNAMESVGGKDWSWSLLPLPAVGLRKAGDGLDDIEDPVAMGDYVASAMRLANGVKSAYMVAQYVASFPEEGQCVTIGRAVENGKDEDLPACLRLPEGQTLPVNSKVGIVVQCGGDGTMCAIKTITFDKPMPMTSVKQLIRGDALVPVFRNGPWGVKKAVTWLLSRVPGFHVSYQCVSKSAAANVQRAKTKDSLDIPDEEIDEGVDFIHQNCPTDEGESDMSKWIWKNIKASANTPVSGWPENKVRRVAENKKKSAGVAKVERFFPLTLKDMNIFWWIWLLPLVVPLLLECGVLMLGVPGVGKTPFFMALAMAFGRFRQRTRQAGQPGWRRGKCWDDFKEVYTGITVTTHRHT